MSPVYAYACPNCKTTQELTRNVHGRDEMLFCSCGAQMKRQPTAAAFQVQGFNASNGYTKEKA